MILVAWTYREMCVHAVSLRSGYNKQKYTMSELQNKVGMAQDEIEPPYDDPEKQPKTLTKSRHIDNVFYLAGRKGNPDKDQYDLMFVCTSAEEEEMARVKKNFFGFHINQEAEYLRGASSVIKLPASRAYIDFDDVYYTAVCKWLLPRTKRSKPPMKALRWGLPILQDEIKRVKPKIIVCLGKPVFDLLSDVKIAFDDAHGGWFWSDEYHAFLYVMYAPNLLVGKPEYYEQFRIDFDEIHRQLCRLKEGGISEIPVRYSVIRDEESLRDWVAMLQDTPDDEWPGKFDDEGNRLFAVDCEWHGRNFLDGNLRTIQFAWTDSDAVVVEFRDEQNCFSFKIENEIEDDLPELFERKKYAYIGGILGSLLNGPKIRYIGHQVSADAAWMKHWLNLETFERVYMDTLYAQQAVDESSTLSLERGIAMRYTTLGLYNLDLAIWKREHKSLWENGYGFVPSEILIPYAVKDVITPFRAAPKIRQLLEIQYLWDYYRKILNPFVSDVFTEFLMGGLPTDVKLIGELRELYHFAKDRLDKKFKQRVHQEAQSKLFEHLFALEPVAPKFEPVPFAELYLTMQQQSGPQEALELVKPYLDTDSVGFWSKLCQHIYDAPNFNIRSPDQMRTWLFDVQGLTPIKSTNQKAKGLPSMAWEKVLELPPERQRIYTPAVDKQTLQILSEEFNTLDELLNLNAVGNVCKAFLKKADEYEDEEGSVTTEEQGIMAWVCGDLRIRYNMSMTETSRTRTFAPNILNLPSYVNKRIQESITRAVREAHEEGELPEGLMRWVGVENIPSVRSCFKADPGCLFVESDLQTAEMHALANISGDRDLMRILNDPDPEWAILKPGRPGPYVRVAYASYEMSGIPFDKQNPDYIMSVWKDGKCLGKVTEDDLERNPDGSVMHRKYDIHWSVVERTYGRPREEMVEKVHRNAGKVLNFSSAYGASPNSLERKIESDTGVKPEPGTGQKGLDAIAARQPRATQFLEEMAEIPARGGYYRAASGRIRHCVVHGDSADVGWRTKKSIESALGREFRNFPMQESVAATAARACKWAMDTYRKLGLKARPVVCLYDSLVTMCPYEERFVVAKLHQVFLSDINGWEYNDVHGHRILRYGIDTEFNERWSTNVKSFQKQMEDKDYYPTPEHLKWIMDFANWDLVVS